MDSCLEFCLMPREYASVTQGSAENGSSYMFDWVLSISWVLNMLGLEYARVVISQGYTGFYVNCILKIHGILDVLSSEYAKVLNVSYVYICCSYKGF